jgi:hypothetical protein
VRDEREGSPAAAGGEISTLGECDQRSGDGRQAPGPCGRRGGPCGRIARSGIIDGRQNEGRPAAKRHSLSLAGALGAAPRIDSRSQVRAQLAGRETAVPGVGAFVSWNVVWPCRFFPVTEGRGREGSVARASMHDRGDAMKSTVLALVLGLAVSTSMVSAQPVRWRPTPSRRPAPRSISPL